MLDITILAVGKIKKEYFQTGCDEYLKRLSPYARIKMEEVQAEPFDSNVDSDRVKSKQKEGVRILAFLEKFPESYVFLMDEHGQSITSTELAQKVENLNKHIIFVIGGALGFSEEVLKYNAEKISLSMLTFPHEMARMILLEQIYRAITILKNKNYHY